MQEVSAGATDTAEHVQNQLEQTHAIQDKVDEVATAVEEIGNSMTVSGRQTGYRAPGIGS